jgi:hypothetical protein
MDDAVRDVPEPPCPMLKTLKERISHPTLVPWAERMLTALHLLLHAYPSNRCRCRDGSWHEASSCMLHLAKRALSANSAPEGYLRVSQRRAADSHGQAAAMQDLWPGAKQETSRQSACHAHVGVCCDLGTILGPAA